MVYPGGGSAAPGGRRATKAGTPEPEIDAAGVERVDDAELLDDRQRRVVAELHRAGPDAYVLCRPGDEAHDEGGCGPGDAGVEMVLGDPVPRVPGGFGALREVERVAQRGRRGRAGRDRDEVEDRERERRPSHAASL